MMHGTMLLQVDGVIQPASYRVEWRVNTGTGLIDYPKAVSRVERRRLKCDEHRLLHVAGFERQGTQLVMVMKSSDVVGADAHLVAVTEGTVTGDVTAVTAGAATVDVSTAAGTAAPKPAERNEHTMAQPVTQMHAPGAAASGGGNNIGAPLIVNACHSVNPVETAHVIAIQQSKNEAVMEAETTMGPVSVPTSVAESVPESVVHVLMEPMVADLQGLCSEPAMPAQQATVPPEPQARTQTQTQTPEDVPVPLESSPIEAVAAPALPVSAELTGHKPVPLQTAPFAPTGTGPVAGPEVPGSAAAVPGEQGLEVPAARTDLVLDPVPEAPEVPAGTDLVLYPVPDLEVPAAGTDLVPDPVPAEAPKVPAGTDPVLDPVPEPGLAPTTALPTPPAPQPAPAPPLASLPAQSDPAAAPVTSSGEGDTTGLNLMATDGSLAQQAAEALDPVASAGTEGAEGRLKAAGAAALISASSQLGSPSGPPLLLDNDKSAAASAPGTAGELACNQYYMIHL